MSRENVTQDYDLKHSLRIAPYVFCGSLVLELGLLRRSSPPLGFLGIAMVSGVLLALAKWLHWKTDKAFYWVLAFLSWFVPFQVAQELFFRPRSSLGWLPMLDYTFLMIATFTGLLWLFRGPLTTMRGIQ